MNGKHWIAGCGLCIDELRDAGLNAPNQSSVLQNRSDVESLRARLQILSSTGASAREGTITGLDATR